MTPSREATLAVRRVWRSLRVIWCGGLLIAALAASAHAHPSHELAATLPQVEAKSGASAPVAGAINLGLAGQGLHMGSYAATVLEPQLRERMQTGTHQHSGAAHFGGSPSEDVVLAAAQAGESVKDGPRCQANAPARGVRRGPSVS